MQFGRLITTVHGVAKISVGILRASCRDIGQDKYILIYGLGLCVYVAP